MENTVLHTEMWYVYYRLNDSRVVIVRCLVINITRIITKTFIVVYNNYYFYYRIVHSPDVVSNAFKNDFLYQVPFVCVYARYSNKSWHVLICVLTYVLIFQFE